MTIARSASPTGWEVGVDNTSQGKIIENVVAGLTFDKLWRESYLSRIANNNTMKPLEAFGDTITWRLIKAGTVRPYTVNTEVTPEATSGDKFSATVDRAFYTYQVLDAVDLKQINVLRLEDLAQRLADDHAENEYKEAISFLITTITGATAMAAYGEQTPGRIYYKPATPTAAATTTRTDANYIIKQFLKARKKANQLGIPKKGRFALVNSDVEEILMNADQFTYNVSGQTNAKAIEDGEFGMRIAGYDIIVSDEIPTAGTYDTQTNIAQCILGHQQGFAFCRQITETDINFKMERRFGRGCRQLNIFGFGLSDSRLMGFLPIKVA